MIHKGYMPSLEQARTLGQSAAFQSGKAALAIDGDWTIGTYSATKGIKVGYSPQPAGPKGSLEHVQRARRRDLGRHQAQARGAQVGQLPGPQACQSIVGTEAVVFPAIKSEVPKAVAKHKQDGIDVSAFTSYIESGNTVLYPITDKAPQINLIVQPTLEEFLNGNEDADEGLQEHERAGQQPAQVRRPSDAPPARRSRRISRPSPPPRRRSAATRSPAPTAAPRCASSSRSSLYLAAIVGRHAPARRARIVGVQLVPFLLFVNLMLVLNWLLFADRRRSTARPPGRPSPTP